MLAPRCALAAAALSGCIYAIGGQEHKLTQRSVEAFDVGSERWVPLDHSPLTFERKYTAVSLEVWMAISRCG